MRLVMILGAERSFVERVQSIPGHQAIGLDRVAIDALARVDGLDSLVTMDERVADVVMLGPEIPLSESLSMAESIGMRFPATLLVLVAEPDTDLVLRAMRSGVRDIVSSGIDQGELASLLQQTDVKVASRSKLHERDAGLPLVDPHRVVVVAAPKGGVGKSTIAANLAAEFAKGAPRETVLIDLDLQFGNAASLLDLEPLHTIDDAFFGSAAAMDTLILKTYLTVHRSGFYVLCGATSPTLKETVTVDQVTRLLRQLSIQFPNIVVDTASGVDELTLAAIAAATDLVMVSSMDVTSTKALRRELDLLRHLDLMPASTHVVMNFADRSSGVETREVESRIGMPIDAVLPRSLDVSVLANLGRTVMDARPRSAFAKAIRHVATRVRADEKLVAGSKHRRIEVA